MFKSNLLSNFLFSKLPLFKNNIDVIDTNQIKPLYMDELVNSYQFFKLPSKIKSQPIFNQIKFINKPFPYLGLLNHIDNTPIKFRSYNNAFIGFSSYGLNGFWDLATMSMRGVVSCMSWSQKNSLTLGATLTDPFVGIIYITDKTDLQYGYKIITRALVRLVHTDISSVNNMHLFIEQIYFNNSDSSSYNGNYNNKDHVNEAEIAKIFINYIKSKLKSFKIKNNIYEIKKVFYSKDYDLPSLYIPYSDSYSFHHQPQYSDANLITINYPSKSLFLNKFQKQI